MVRLLSSDSPAIPLSLTAIHKCRAGVLRVEAVDARENGKRYHLEVDKADVAALIAGLRASHSADYITAEQYPMLAEIWDNEDDAIYDNM